MTIAQRLVSSGVRNWLRDLPKQIKATRTNLEVRRALIIEALVPSGYSFEYRWYRLREAFGLLADDE